MNTILTCNNIQNTRFRSMFGNLKDIIKFTQTLSTDTSWQHTNHTSNKSSYSPEISSTHSQNKDKEVKLTKNEYDSICVQYSQKLISHLKSKKYTKNFDFKKINNALEYAKRYHMGQMRASNEPYFIHPIEVAIIVSDHLKDQDSIIAAILHDVLEDTKSPIPEVKLLFGDDAVIMICKLTKMSNNKLKLSSVTAIDKMLKIDNYCDNKAFIIKLCDRLHNMRTIEHMPLHKQIKKAEETIKILLPLAKYMKLPIVEELEELCLKILNKS